MLLEAQNDFDGYLLIEDHVYCFGEIREGDDSPATSRAISGRGVGLTRTDPCGDSSNRSGPLRCHRAIEDERVGVLAGLGNLQCEGLEEVRLNRRVVCLRHYVALRTGRSHARWIRTTVQCNRPSARRLEATYELGDRVVSERAQRVLEFDRSG